MSDQRAAQYQQWLARLSALAAVRMRRLWRDRVDPGDIAGSWRTTLGPATALLQASTTAAAAQAEPYIAGMVTDAGLTPEPVARLLTDAFPPTRPVAQSQLVMPVIRTVQRIGGGTPPAEAITYGEWLVGAITNDTTTGAGRDAVAAAMTAEPQVTGYVREISGATTCGRCAILAGRVYRYSDGFDRHEQCDCTHRPLVKGEQPRRLDVNGYFDSLTPTQQNRLFGASEADAIRGGADPTKTVNIKMTRWRSAQRANRHRTPSAQAVIHAAGSRTAAVDDLVTARYAAMGIRTAA